MGGYSGSLGKLTFHSARERSTPRELNPFVTTLTRQLQCLPHTGQSAGALDRGGVGSSGRLRSFRAKFFACLRWGIRDAATACARDGELQWPQQPSVFVRSPGAEAGQYGLLPLVRVESVCVASQSPVTVVRRGSGLCRWAQIILSSNATMPVLHVSVSCVWSNAFLAYASQAPFSGTSTM
ncbi:hypothetical protein TcCL_Unassigned01635 [Trypanosoma cruzi]|nr:hypothetical protein TcCL_Unassigned01635 [Trypanosoma cruzi]